MADLIHLTDAGLYCPAGNFHIDPWRPVHTALLTHIHGDHARAGSEQYVTHEDGVAIARRRLGEDIAIDPVEYGQTLEMGGVRVSFHSAGHILGSSQIRVEHNGETWVVSGDYKRAQDPTCAPFEPVPCDTFITEATFSLPVYRWRSGSSVVSDVYQWWRKNAEEDKASVLFCYALGKAQRVLAHLTEHTDDAVFLHGAMEPIVAIYRQAGVGMVPTTRIGDNTRKQDFTGTLTIAPPSAAGSPWMRRFGKHSTGFCSGWMRVRGNRRRRGYDRGFILSDHADWPALIKTIRESGASRVLATHGKTDVLVRYLRERGINAQPLKTEYGDEDA